MRYGETTKKIRLKSAYLSESNGKANLALTFSGKELALATANSNLTALLGASAYVERDTEENTLKVVTSLTGDDPMRQAQDFAEKIHLATQFNLSHVELQPDFDQIGEGAKATYSSAIRIEPVTSNKTGDITGELCKEILCSEHGMQSHFVADPRSDTSHPRLMCIDKSYETDSDALQNAEAIIREMERNYGLSKAQTHDLSLSGLQTRTMKHRSLGDHELSMSIARLTGAPDALDDALRTLKHRHRNRIAELGRGEDHLDIGAAAQDHLDPTGLLAAVHLATGCKIPVDVVTAVTRGKQPPYPYEPVLETRIIGDDSGVSQPTMRFAAARYAGSFIPGGNYSVPDDIDPHGPSRIIVHHGHTTEQKAQDDASTLAERIRARLSGQAVEGHDYHGR